MERYRSGLAALFALHCPQQAQRAPFGHQRLSWLGDGCSAPVWVGVRAKIARLPSPPVQPKNGDDLHDACGIVDFVIQRPIGRRTGFESANKFWNAAAVHLILSLFVSSCADPAPIVQTVEVRVPVPVPAEVPAELLADLPPVPRASVSGAVCFDADGVAALTAFIDEARARLAATRALAGQFEPVEGDGPE